MININEGDVLIYGGADFEVKAVEFWKMDSARTESFKRIATETIGIRRPPTLDADFKRGTPTLRSVNIAATPLDPVNPEVQLSRGLQGGFEVRQTFLADDDGFWRVFLQEKKG